MSKRHYVQFREDGFWAFDVVSSVLLKHVIDLAAPRVEGREWLAEAVHYWQVCTAYTDLALFFEGEWSADQVGEVRGLFAAACDAIAAREEIPAAEVESWPAVDGLTLFARGLPAVPTKPVVNLGRAIIQLFDGTLPDPPPGTWWFFGVDDMPNTMPKRED